MVGPGKPYIAAGRNPEELPGSSGLSPADYGVLISIYAVGGLAASLVAHQVIAWLGPGTMPRISPPIEAAITATMALMQAPFLVGAAFLLLAFKGVAWSSPRCARS